MRLAARKRRPDDFRSLQASVKGGWDIVYASYFIQQRNNNNNSQNFILIYKSNIRIQISLMICNFYSACLIAGISSGKNLNE